MQAWKKSNSKLKRKENISNPRHRILIVCEGSKTEPNYFNEFPVDKQIVAVDIKGIGYNTLSLVDKAIEIKEKAEAAHQPYNQVWCVFDRDSFTPSNFDNAIKKAADKNLKVAYSNEAFEIWYLLHFEYYDTAINRSQYIKLLSSKINQLTKGQKTKYMKNDTEIYKLLLNKQSTAINNAKKLNECYRDRRYSKHNPRTTVFLLVEELKRHFPNNLSPTD